MNQLVRLCEHNEIKAHPFGSYWQRSVCPGGVFLPESVIVVPLVCPVCGHEFNRHDPEDGQCDAWPGGDHCDSFKVVAFLSTVALVGLEEASVSFADAINETEKDDAR